MIALLLFACATRTPAAVFPVPPPAPPAAPAPVEHPVEPDACDQAAPLIPGRPAPFTVDGVAVCRAQVVPDAQVFDLLEQADAAIYWRDRTLACEAYRAADREHAQAVADSCWGQSEHLQGELRVARAVGPAVFVAGVAVGLGFGIAASAVAP